jgi:aminopeptidase N
MENFGLAIGSIWQIRSVTLMIAHEIAHHWCGNAVSPKFWDSLWLNEGCSSRLGTLE